jgi:hypothetical protein
MSDYKATPEQRAIFELRAKVEALEDKYKMQRLATLEWGKDVENLQRWNDQNLIRIERLEATQQDKLDRLIAQDRDEAPVTTGSLVERVSCAIDGRINPDQWLHQDAARAAIREVAAWLRDHYGGPTASSTALEQEVER